MPTYVVTGKLGSGKTLASVGRIRDALIEGRPVATNLDLDLAKLVGKKAKKVKVYRLPDKPDADDLKALGSGNDSYEEERNGLLVLDECGTWFNARDWNDKSRRPLIDWLIHARKWGWDPYFIIQDVSAMDKQARKSLAEHVVYCRRMDRFTIPIVDWVAKLATNRPVPKKKWHVGIVKYGDLPHSVTVDRWWYIGSDLYPAYDTKQIFRDDYPHGLYQLLPPYYTHGRYQRPRDLRFIMRLTRIYFRRYSRTLLMSLAFGGGIAAAGMLSSEPEQPEPEIITVTEEPEEPDTEDAQDQPGPDYLNVNDEEEPPMPLEERFAGMVIKGVALDSDGDPMYVKIGNDRETWNLDSLRAAGYEVFMPNQCEVTIMADERRDRHTVHTSYCPENRIHN